MCREFHRVMGQHGPSHTTLLRYSIGNVKRRNVLTEQYVREAIHKVIVELAQKELSESETLRNRVEKELHETEARFQQLVVRGRNILYRYRLVPTRGFEYISPTVTDIVGYTPQEHYADPDLSLKIVHPDDRQKTEKYFKGEGAFNEGETFRYIHKNGSLVWIEQAYVPIYGETGNLVALEGIARDITERKDFEQALLSVVQGTSWTVGEDFPRSLVQQLAAALQVRFAFLAELHPTIKKRARLLAIWEGTGYGENFDYDTTGTPCEHVFENTISYYPADLQKIFPDDPWVKEKGIESYLAIPVHDPGGNPIGHLGVMHGSPMPQGPPRESILRIFAARAGAELELRRAEGKHPFRP